MPSKWIQSAIRHPGALRALAEKEGAMTSKDTIKVGWLRMKASPNNPDLHVRREALLALKLRSFRT